MASTRRSSKSDKGTAKGESRRAAAKGAAKAAADPSARSKGRRATRGKPAPKSSVAVARTPNVKPAPVAASPFEGQAYQIKVTLENSDPPIWRQLLVPADIFLDELHAVLQVAFGWTNSHLHQFIVAEGREERYLSHPDFELDDADDESEFCLAEIAPKTKTKSKPKLLYEYDFGDGWIHEIVVEKVQPFDDGRPVLRCLAGQRAGPPEDIGGVWGYLDLLDALKNPAHENHEWAQDMLGEDYDPAVVDLEAINEVLSEMLEVEK